MKMKVYKVEYSVEGLFKTSNDFETGKHVTYVIAENENAAKDCIYAEWQNTIRRISSYT